MNQSTPSDINMSYEWSVLDDLQNEVNHSTKSDPHFIIADPGTYSVQLIAIRPEGCADSVTHLNCITVYPQPVAAFTANPAISYFSESQGIILFDNQTDISIIGTDYFTYSWDFGDGESDNTVLSPSHTYADWGDYTVVFTIITEHDCSSSITHTVVLEPDLEFPNVITPNGDNKNDVFAITNLNTAFDPNDPNGFRANELFIYDRWGKRVYHAKNYDTYAKDGVIHVGSQYFDAMNLSDGVYYYTFHYKGMIKDIDYHGTLSVFR